MPFLLNVICVCLIIFRTYIKYCKTDSIYNAIVHLNTPIKAIK